VDGVVRNNKGRPLYLLWLEEYEPLDQYLVRSSLPEELIWYTCRDILSHKQNLNNKRNAEVTLSKIRKRLSHSRLTKYFWLPEEVLILNQVNQEVYEYFYNLISGDEDITNDVYSPFYNTIEFQALCFDFNRAQFLSFHEFEREVELITRRQFERNLRDRSVGEYVKYYSFDNIFYLVQERGKAYYMMTTGFELNVVIVITEVTPN
jgi:hypothetical protein